MPLAYLIHDDNSTVAMDVVRCKDEDKELQSLLEKNFDLLAGDQIDIDEPRQWLLIKREMPVPDPGTWTDRWSIDFLFADQDGWPTFVECKRFSDTRSRREVVAQMLEYAANAQRYWDSQTLRQYAEQSNPNLEEAIHRLKRDDSVTVDGFIDSIINNMKEGQIRLIFFLEESPQELRSIIDFLNKQMEKAEVLIVEARQYTSGTSKVVIPYLFGYTEQARLVKRKVTVQSEASPSARTWDKMTFFEALTAVASDPEVKLAHELYDFSVQITGRDPRWGKGKDRGSFTASIFLDKERYTLFSLYTTGKVSLNLGWNKDRLDALDDSLSEKYRSRAEKELGFVFDQDAWERGWPMAPLAKLLNKKQEFYKIINEFISEVKGRV